MKETYSDDELMTLLKKPEADCKFCEYRNWVIVNFLLNSGCRAATVRNIQNQDVDLSLQADCSQTHEERQGSGHSPLFCNGWHSEGLHGSS